MGLNVLTILSMKYLIYCHFLVVCLVNSSLLLAQVNEFDIDSMAMEGGVHLFLRSVRNPTEEHHISLTMSDSGVVNAWYFGPILWMGEGAQPPGPAVVNDDVKIHLELLIGEAQIRKFQGASRNLKGKWIVRNWYPDPYWERLYKHIEDLIFGEAIRQQCKLRDHAIAAESFELLGDYSSRFRYDPSCDLLDIFLTPVSNEFQSGNEICRWIIRQDVIEISGPCFNGLFGHCGWELVSIFGTWRLVLKEPDCSPLWGPDIDLNFMVYQKDDGRLLLSTYEPMKFLLREAGKN